MWIHIQDSWIKLIYTQWCNHSMNIMKTKTIFPFTIQSIHILHDKIKYISIIQWQSNTMNASIYYMIYRYVNIFFLPSHVDWKYCYCTSVYYMYTLYTLYILKVVPHQTNLKHYLWNVHCTSKTDFHIPWCTWVLMI